MRLFLTNDVALNRAREKHPELSFEKFVYTRCCEPVIITCKIHGDQKILYNNLISRKKIGCNKCAHKNSEDTRVLSSEKAIKNIQKVYPEISFDKFYYINSYSLITLTCPLHGDFQATYANIVYNQSKCPKCSNKLSKGEQWVHTNLKNNSITYKSEFTCLIETIYGIRR